MNVRIGITESGKVVELEIDDVAAFKATLDKAVAEGGLAWFTDTKSRDVGIPAVKIGYVEIDTEDGSHTIGFAPAV